MKNLRILLVGCIFLEGATILLLAQALSNLGHAVKFWNVKVREKPTDNDYDMAIVWMNRPLPKDIFGDKPVCYHYLDDPDYWKQPTDEKNPLDCTIENCSNGFEYTTTNMKWDGFDDNRYIWLPMGCLSDVHGKHILSAEQQQRYGSDIVFIGTSRNKRPELLKNIAKHVNKKYTFKVWGNGWGPQGYNTKAVYFYEFSKVLCAAKIVITEHWKNGFSTNDAEKPACGGALTITDCPIVKQEYPNMPFYRTPEEAAEIINYYLEHEEERTALTLELQKQAYEKFNFELQLSKMIYIVMNKIPIKQANEIAKLPCSGWDFSKCLPAEV